MPWQGSKFVQDGRSPLERLYGYQETMAKMQAMKQQQDLMRERQKILAESLTPAQAGSMDVQFSQQQPAAMSFPQIFQQQLTGGASANLLGAQDPEQVKLTQTEAKPSQFDAESAVSRLYGIGDVDTATKLAAAEEKQNRDLNRWSGAVTYIDDPENPGVTIAVQPSTQGDGEAYRKIGVAGMSPEARTRAQQKDADLANDREKIGMARQQFLFEQRKFYEGPEVQARQQQIEDAAKKGASAANTMNVIATIEPYLDVASGSDLAKMARKGGSFIGFDSAAATADRMIEQGAAALTLAAPKLGGAASDRDVDLYRQSMGSLSSGTTQQKREAIKVIKRLLGQYGEAAPGQPQAAPRPTATTRTAPAAGIPQAAIAKLRSDPSLAKAFDAKYGSGMAAKVLSK